MSKETKFIFRREPVPYTGRKGLVHFYDFYRQPKTAQEMRISCDPELFLYIRGRRRMVSLWFAWDDFPRCIQRCWKYQRKVKKQWMIHKK